MEKVTLIATVFNEEKTIENFLASIEKQTQLPDEVVIVDGGSTDRTFEILTAYSQTKGKFEYRVFQKKTNRAAGRNLAFSKSSHEIIACSDSGCILDGTWLEEIVKPFKNTSVDVVAGYYQGIGKTDFEKCVILYMLVMPDRVDSANFLPATRSMALRKSVWNTVGGFDEKYVHNEDYVFAHKLKKNNISIFFAKDAIVYWTPPHTLSHTISRFYQFAYCDAEAHLYRPKVLFIFMRYVIGSILVFVAFYQPVLFLYIALFFILYLLWSIWKNYTYVRRKMAFVYLPILQIVSDITIIIGTTFGFIASLWDTQNT